MWPISDILLGDSASTNAAESRADRTFPLELASVSSEINFLASLSIISFCIRESLMQKLIIHSTRRWVRFSPSRRPEVTLKEGVQVGKFTQHVMSESNLNTSTVRWIVSFIFLTLHIIIDCSTSIWSWDQLWWYRCPDTTSKCFKFIFHHIFLVLISSCLKVSSRFGVCLVWFSMHTN